MTKVTRNIVIVLALAAVVVYAPGGGTASQVVIQAVSILFLASIGWFASMMYRQRRVSLYSLGDRRRAALYGAAAVAVVTLTATSRLWNAGGGGVLVWLVLVGTAAYTVIAILWAARSY
ncbi:MAG TPA: hypothetical protein VG295_12765 [Solirubrobacteraceae bacterium]|nr:hypothetical protein [Solirubrobacteraceae bacterium]